MAENSVEAGRRASSVNAPLRLYLRWMHTSRSTLRDERRDLPEENDRTNYCETGSAGQKYGEDDRDHPVRGATLRGCGAHGGISFQGVVQTSAFTYKCASGFENVPRV